MTAGTATLTCSICLEPSTDICVYCTKDACANHRCDRCKRCSDCCECDVPLSAKEVHPEPPTEAAVEVPVEVAAEVASDDEFSIFAPEPDIFAPEPDETKPPEESQPSEEIIP